MKEKLEFEEGGLVNSGKRGELSSPYGTFTIQGFGEIAANLNEIRDITIFPPVSNGYKVKVGCKEFVFSNQKDMFKAISEYFKDPKAAYKKHVRNK